MAYPRFRGYVDEPTALFRLDSKASPVVLESHNTLVRDYWWANGVKTGETIGAGFCIVASGAPGGAEIIVTLLGASSLAQRHKDAVALFEWAAPQYSWWASPGEEETAAVGFAPGGAEVDLRVHGEPVQASLAPGADVRLSLDRTAGRRLPAAPALQLVFATWYADGMPFGERLLRGEAPAASPSPSASSMGP
jgi:D-alanyl-D-alanine carboxypeptidase